MMREKTVGAALAVVELELFQQQDGLPAPAQVTGGCAAHGARADHDCVIASAH